MDERLASNVRQAPVLEKPHVKIHIRPVETLRRRHQMTYLRARSTLETMSVRHPAHGERRNEKLHVAVALKLKGVSTIFVAENTAGHHAERVLAEDLVRLKRVYDARREPFPKIQSLALIARHPNSGDDEVVLPRSISIDTLPEGTPCMCEKCVRLFRRLLKYLYPEPERASEDSDVSYEKRYNRWRKTKNFPILIGIGNSAHGLAIKTNFHTAPMIPFPGSKSAKTVHDLLREHRHNE